MEERRGLSLLSFNFLKLVTTDSNIVESTWPKVPRKSSLLDSSRFEYGSCITNGAHHHFKTLVAEDAYQGLDDDGVRCVLCCGFLELTTSLFVCWVRWITEIQRFPAVSEGFDGFVPVNRRIPLIPISWKRPVPCNFELAGVVCAALAIHLYLLCSVYAFRR